MDNFLASRRAIRHADQKNSKFTAILMWEDIFKLKINLKEIMAPIITANNYIANPYAPFKKDAIGAEYQLTAVFVTYKYSFS